MQAVDEPARISTPRNRTVLADELGQLRRAVADRNLCRRSRAPTGGGDRFNRCKPVLGERDDQVAKCPEAIEEPPSPRALGLLVLGSTGSQLIYAARGGFQEADYLSDFPAGGEGV